MYLMQYIKESQGEYPNISRTPLDVLSHLLFTCGNGIQSIDGNPGQLIKNKLITFKEFYKNERSFQEIKEWYNKNSNKELQNIYDFNEKMNNVRNLKFTKEDIIQKSYDEFNARYDKLDLVDNYTLKDLKNPDVYIKMQLEDEYNSFLELSDTYYMQYYFTYNTDVDLLEVALAISKAYISIFKTYIDNPKILECKKPLLGKHIDDETPRLCLAAKRDTLTLERDIIKIEKLLNQHRRLTK